MDYNQYIETIKNVLIKNNSECIVTRERNGRSVFVPTKDLVDNGITPYLETQWDSGEREPELDAFDHILLKASKHKELSHVEYKILSRNLISVTEQSKSFNEGYDENGSIKYTNYKTYTKAVDLKELYDTLKDMNLLKEYVPEEPKAKVKKKINLKR